MRATANSYRPGWKGSWSASGSRAATSVSISWGPCRRVPGIHYAHYEFVGSAKPGPEEYRSVCRDCWPKSGGIVLDSDTDDDTSESGSATESQGEARDRLATED